MENLLLLFYPITKSFPVNLKNTASLMYADILDLPPPDNICSLKESDSVEIEFSCERPAELCFVGIAMFIWLLSVHFAAFELLKMLTKSSNNEFIVTPDSHNAALLNTAKGIPQLFRRRVRVSEGRF